MNNKKKIVTSIFIVLILIVVVASGTYAVYRWRSTYGLNVSISVNDNVTVTFNGGTNITGRLVPTVFPLNTISKKMTIRSNLPGAYYSLYLKTKELPANIKNSQFKWLLSDCDYNNNNACNSDIEISGDFSTSSMNEYIDSSTGDMLLIDSSKVPFKYTQELYLYLWIDGTVDNDPSIGNNHIDFDLYATGTINSTNGSVVEGS